jgi:methylthioribose-1-phosphate isomerase
MADEGADRGRREFLRSFSRDAVQKAAQAAGLAVTVQRSVGTAVGSALGIIPVDAPAPDPAPPGPQPPAAPGPDRGPPESYRVGGEALVLIDLQRLPDEVVEVRCTDPYQVASAMLGRQVLGAALLGQVTAYGMWLAVLAARGLPPGMKRNKIRAAGAAFRAARSNVATIPWAVDRMVQAWDAASALESHEPTLEASIREAADAVAAKIASAVATIGRLGADAVPAPRSERLGVVIFDPPPQLAGGTPGTTVGLIERLAAGSLPVDVWLLESGLTEATARLATRALAGVPVEVTVTSIPYASLAWLLASQPIDLVLVGADRLALDGAATATIGTYGAAALAAVHGVPFWVATPLAAVDPTVPDAAGSLVDREPYRSALAAPGQGSGGPAGGRGPLQDVTPAGLIDVIVTEAGVLRAPFATALMTGSDPPAA